jgi:hypothetical protein
MSLNLIGLGLICYLGKGAEQVKLKAGDAATFSK